MLAVFAPTALSDLAAVVGRTTKLTATIVLDQMETVTIRRDGLPSYAFPEDAARAFGHACSCGRWRARPTGTVRRYADLRTGQARAVIEDSSAGTRTGVGCRWRRPLGCYGVPLVPWRWARSEEQAVRAAAELGGHVVLKSDVPG